MVSSEHSVKSITNQAGSHFCYITIVVPASYVSWIYNEAALAQKDKTSTYGFAKGATPLGYIQEHYKNNLLEHVQELLFKYLVINALYQEIYKQKLLIAGEPRLHDINVEPDKDAEFCFELALTPPIQFREWKNFPFKAPKRKNYKDIDRQVESFIKQEQALLKEHTDDAIHIGDWVCFDINLLNRNNEPLANHYKENLWLKVGNEEADAPFQDVFLNKKIGEEFCTSNTCFQNYFSTNLDTHYIFLITIQDIVHHDYFSLDQFKHHFKLKNNKDVHQKLIEVFSYRNDMSQRRGIVEEALKLLLSKHHIDVPNYLILRQQKIVLESVQNNPDYHVYKSQQNFKDSIKMLAAKQAKELILIDQIMYQEEISISNQDIKGYFNLIKRPRTKEFIYFNPPPTKVEGQEIPIPSALLHKCCMREKTLNHIIHHLTKE